MSQASVTKEGVEELFVRYVMWCTPTIIIRWIIRIFLMIWGTEPRNNEVATMVKTSDQCKKEPITVDAAAANEQHYEVPTAFFLTHLGPRLKYSSCEFLTPTTTLAEAETYSLQEYQRRNKLSELPDGAHVLECGSGWGSLTLFNAATFPKLNFTSFSNSKTQVEHIQTQSKERGLTNINVHVEDYADFCSERSKLHGRKFSRVFGIETVEHSRNIPGLFEWIRLRLANDGMVFIQSLVLQHKMKVMTGNDWMGRNFFTGGQVPAMQSYLHYNEHLRVDELVSMTGKDYERTLNAWLDVLESHGPALKKEFGAENYEKFRMFYLMSAEAFGSAGGCRYMIGYYVLKPTRPT